MWKKIYQTLKILFGLGLICFLVLKIDINSIINRIRDIDVCWLIIMLILAHLNILISSMKWQWLLNALDVTVGLVRLFFLYLMGSFFSNFLPTMVGGDIVKVYKLARDDKGISTVITATFAERFCGFIALITFVFLILFQKSIYVVYPIIKLLVIGILVLSLVVVFLVLQQKYLSYFVYFKRFKLFARILHILADIRSKLIQLKDKKTIVFASYIVSLFFYVIAMFTVYAAARSLNIQVEAKVLMVVVPLVLLIGHLPVSLGGLGISEAGYVYFFTLFGLSSVDAISIALLLRARMLLTGLMGGITFMLYDNFQQYNHVSSITLKGVIGEKKL